MSGFGSVAGRRVGTDIMERSQRQPAVFWNVAWGPGDERRGWRRRWGTGKPLVSGSGHGKRDILGRQGAQRV